jgi:hypothetical protein
LSVLCGLLLLGVFPRSFPRGRSQVGQILFEITFKYN